MIKVVLVDDHIVVRDGIKTLLINSGEIDVVGEASDYNSLLSLLKISIPDIIMLDISLPGKSGIEIAQILEEKFPKVRVIILSMYTDEDFIYNALKAGAKSYLPKNISQKELIEAVLTVNSGGEYFNEVVSNIILKSYVKKAKREDQDSKSNYSDLTNREKEVLKLFAGGLSNSEIAEKLFISVRTVESHKNHIMTKLELKSVVDLVKFALKNDIIKI
jgi:DNA-binding NarL/FixJ family response regulator